MATACRNRTARMVGSAVRRRQPAVPPARETSTSPERERRDPTPSEAPGPVAGAPGLYGQLAGYCVGWAVLLLLASSLRAQPPGSSPQTLLQEAGRRVAAGQLPEAE